MRKLSKLTQELALALEVASHAQAWGNPSPFQDKINELLVKAGRKPVAHLTKRVPDAANVCRVINHFYVEGVCSRVARKSRGAGNAKPLGVPPPKKEDATAILLFISVGFTLYFRSIEMYSAAIGSAIVAVFVLVLWIGEL